MYYCYRWLSHFCTSLVPRPHSLTRRNGLVNQVKFPGLVHTFATMQSSNDQNTCGQPAQKSYGYSSSKDKFLLL